MRAAPRQRTLDVPPEPGQPALVVPIDPSLQRAVDEAEADLARGEHVEHDEVMAKLRRWADGA
jgi:hypothetical protein